MQNERLALNISCLYLHLFSSEPRELRLQSIQHRLNLHIVCPTILNGLDRIYHVRVVTIKLLAQVHILHAKKFSRIVVYTLTGYRYGLSAYPTVNIFDRYLKALGHSLLDSRYSRLVHSWKNISATTARTPTIKSREGFKK